MKSILAAGPAWVRRTCAAVDEGLDLLMGTGPVDGSARGWGSIRGVLLDVGGVFVVPRPAGLADIGGPLGGTREHARLVRAHGVAMARADSPVGFDWDTYYRELSLACDVPAEAQDECGLAVRHAARTVPFWWSEQLPGSAAALRSLTGLLPVGIVSNSDGTVQEMLATLGVCQVGPGAGADVQVIVDSAVAGVAKPDPAIFATALAALDVPTGSVAYVGDTVAFDVTGAVAAGLLPVHVDAYGLCAAPDGHAHVASLAEFVAALAAERQ